MRQVAFGRKQLTYLLILLMSVLLLSAALISGRTSATTIIPTLVAGNPTCAQLGYPFEAKIDPANPGVTVHNVAGLGTITITGDADDRNYDWTSTFGIDAVIAKGGPNANVYVYDPPAESFGDTDLNAPLGAGPGGTLPFGMSHMSFCYDIELQVSKTAVTTFDRDWAWTIDKTCDETELILAPGEQIDVDCDVTLGATSQDSNWAVSGDITIHNPAPNTAATVTGVTDTISGIGAVDVDCGDDFPIIIAAGDDLICTYSSDLPNADSRTNTATATTTGIIGGGSGQAAVTFGTTPTTETDECVEVEDDQIGGVIGNVCADDADKTITYTQTVGPYTAPAECGENEFVNIATFTTNDDGVTGNDSHTITVTVPCVLGCTLTQGYWKTHSDQGPAPFDDAWNNLPNVDGDGVAEQEGETFFLSGKTWYQAFWTPPAGNAYYNLAHQYMAARLNQLNGAAVPANVQTAINSAQTLFQTWTPAQIAALKGNNATRAQFISLAGILGSYNQGLIGPGHCSE